MNSGSFNCACGGGYLPDPLNRKKCSKISVYEDSAEKMYFDSYHSFDSASDSNGSYYRNMNQNSNSQLLTGILIERCAPGKVWQSETF